MIILPVLLLGAGVPAAAPPSPSSSPGWPQPFGGRVAVSGIAGLATPGGWLGADLQINLLPWIAVTGGGGAGWGGPQLAAMGKLRAASPKVQGFFLFAGLGFSRGRYEWTDSCFPEGEACDVVSIRRGPVSWRNHELGAEMVVPWTVPLMLRAFVGVSTAIASDLRCVDSPPRECAPGEGEPRSLPYAGVAVGFTL